MRLLMMCAAVLLGMLMPVSAEAPREAGIRAVISAQIEAFRRDDATAAFAIASPTIQDMFGTASNFVAMVERGYPQVYRPRSFEFGALREIDGKLMQRVMLQGPDGGMVVALYEMVEIDGRWRINGCTLLRSGEDA